MSADFDPYHKWLGIPPEDQPPHHYRLLGINAFESDRDVIDNAADKQMVHLKSVVTSRFASQSQIILNELAAARRVLLNEKEKAKYDRQLRSELTVDSKPEKQQPPPPIEPVAPAKPSAVPRDSLTIKKVGGRAMSQRVRRKKSGGPALVIISLAAVGVALAAFMLSKVPQPVAEKNKDSQAKSTPDHHVLPVGPKSVPEPQMPAENDGAPSSEPADEVLSIGQAMDESISEQTKESESPRVTTNNSTPPSESTPDDQSVLPQPDNSPVRDTGLISVTDQNRPDAVLQAKLPVPSSEDRIKRVDQIRQKYKLRSGSSLSERRLLAEQILEDGIRTESDPNTRYAMYSLASKVASENGDVDTALRAVKQMEMEFQVESLDMKLQVMREAARVPEVHAKVVEMTRSLINEAITVNKFEAASDLAKLFSSLTRRANNPQLKKQVVAIRKEIVFQQKEYEVISPYLKVLESQPDDEPSNLEVGRWYCLVKGTWGRGFPLLLKGSDAQFREVAELELQNPNEVKGQMRLGNAWWDAVSNVQGEKKERGQLRAVEWYRKALPKLGEVDKIEIDRRVSRNNAALRRLVENAEGVICKVAKQSPARKIKPTETYTLTSPLPIPLNKTVIRFKTRGFHQSGTFGNISLSLDGINWVVFDKWTTQRGGIADQKNQGWFVTNTSSLPDRMRSDKIQVRFQRTQGSFKLWVTQVVWAFQ